MCSLRACYFTKNGLHLTGNFQYFYKTLYNIFFLTKIAPSACYSTNLCYYCNIFSRSKLDTLRIFFINHANVQ